ncbi:MAG: hypothetical protein SF002_15115 [Alphaproteobacteria bacterium]|nr:hypothetical protein [Alphaproteobacteria bacterium]
MQESVAIEKMSSRTCLVSSVIFLVLAGLCYFGITSSVEKLIGGGFRDHAVVTMDQLMAGVFQVFVSMKVMNAVFSVLSSVEVGATVASLSPGSVIDPLDDLVENFSSYLLFTMIVGKIISTLVKISAFPVWSEIILSLSLLCVSLSFFGRAVVSPRLSWFVVGAHRLGRIGGLGVKVYVLVALIAPLSVIVASNLSLAFSAERAQALGQIKSFQKELEGVYQVLSAGQDEVIRPNQTDARNNTQPQNNSWLPSMFQGAREVMQSPVKFAENGATILTSYFRLISMNFDDLFRAFSILGALWALDLIGIVVVALVVWRYCTAAVRQAI